MCDSTNTRSIEEDVDSKYAHKFIGNPQIDLFPTMFRRPVHYRKFPIELEGKGHSFTISSNKYTNINAIRI